MISATRVVCRLVIVGALAVGVVLPQVKGQVNQPTTGSSGGAGQTQPSANDQTTKFVRQAVRDNSLEMAMAEVGVRKAQNPDLKAFCQQLQNDHKQANEQLRPIAQKYGVALDQPLTKHEEKELSKFEKMSGKEFDRKFATQLLREHQKDINRFERESAQLQAADVKHYAETMLPKLQQHFQHAETVARAVGVDQSTISSIAKKTHGAMGGASGTPQMQSGSGSQQSNPSNSGK